MLAAMLVLGGCDLVFRLDTAKSFDAATDAPPDAPPCPMAGIFDDFSMGLGPCAPWGIAMTGTVSVLEPPGMLTVTTTAGTPPDFGGCTATSTIPFLASGVFIDVESVVTAGTGYVVLRASTTGAGEADAWLTAGPLLLELRGTSGTQPAGMVHYDPTAMRWWRLIPDPGGVAGEYSSDGYNWIRLGVVPGTPPAQIRIRFGVGTTAQETSRQSAVFRHLDVCPPPPR